MTGVTICWDALDGADSYRVYRKIATGWKRLETVQGTSYTDTGTRSGSSYTYTVRGRKADLSLIHISGRRSRKSPLCAGL